MFGRCRGGVVSMFGGVCSALTSWFEFNSCKRRALMSGRGPEHWTIITSAKRPIPEMGDYDRRNLSIQKIIFINS